MKKLLFFGLLFLGLDMAAQTTKGPRPIVISYYGQVLIQPGVKLGTEFPLMSKPDNTASVGTWVLSPQIGLFTNPGDDTHTLLNVEAGLRKHKDGKNAYTTWSLGMGWLNRSKVNSFAVNLGNGQTSDKQRVNSSYLMPSINFEYGWATHKKTSWFTKYGIGRRLLGSQEGRLMLFAELGIKLNWKNHDKTENR